MTDVDVVDRFRDVIGGFVYGPYEPGPPRKPNWLWRLKGLDECSDVYRDFERFLGARRKARIQEALFGASFVDLCEPRTIDGGPLDVAWAAGFFEGEGSIGITDGKRPWLSLKSTDEDVVRWFAKILGGHVNGPYVPSDPCLDGTLRKPVFVWHARRRGLCFEIHGKLDPWLGDRRRGRFEEVVFESLESTTK